MSVLPVPHSAMTTTTTDDDDDDDDDCDFKDKMAAV
jgi:hypothetical protein